MTTTVDDSSGAPIPYFGDVGGGNGRISSLDVGRTSELSGSAAAFEFMGTSTFSGSSYVAVLGTMRQVNDVMRSASIVSDTDYAGTSFLNITV